MSADRLSAGGVVSCTVTVKLADPVTLWESVAEHSTVVVPSGNVEPETGAHVATIGPSITSPADALKVTAAPPGPVASTARLEGTVTTGGGGGETTTDSWASPPPPPVVTVP